MFRRDLLGTAALSIAGLAGCTAPSESDDLSSETPSSSATPGEPDGPDAVTPDPDDPIEFVLTNSTDSRRRVRLSLTAGDRTLLDESLTLDPGASQRFDPGIDTPGDYDLSVDVEDGPRRSQTLAIERFDVRQGSNHFVDIGDGDIRIFWEE